MTQEFGSLDNMMEAGVGRDIVPEVGMGATILSWTDRHPATVVEVGEDKKTFVLQQDNAKRTDKEGMSECQSYEYTPNPSAPRKTVRLTPKGWKIVGGHRVALGMRERYHDFSF